MENMRYPSFLSKLRLPALLVLLAVFGASCVYTPASSFSTGLPAQNPLNDWLSRGPQPREADLEMLEARGVRTIVNFRNEPGWIKWEKEKVENLGMHYVSLPWSITKPVKPELLDSFFKVLDDPKNRPVFFHCQYGRDRSGVMSVLALMRYERMSEEEARQFTFDTIRPHLRYKPFVNQKIKFFLEKRPSAFSRTEPASR